jgi:glucose/arabinose dehydrogenase
MEGGAIATAPILTAEGAHDMRRIGILTAVVSMVMAGLAGPMSQTAVAGGVRAIRVASGLASPVGFTFMPGGRLVYVERNTGWLRFRNLQTDTDVRVHRILNVNFDGERGALGVALHPAWPSQPFVYVYVTRNTTDGLRNQVLRIKVENDDGVAVRRLLSVAAGPAGNHNGEPARQDPPSEPGWLDPRHEPVRHPDLGIRDPQLDRVRLRSAERPPLGVGERARL